MEQNLSQKADFFRMAFQLHRNQIWVSLSLHLFLAVFIAVVFLPATLNIQNISMENTHFLM